MGFAFVQVDGHAARVPGSGEISLERRWGWLRHKEKPPKTQSPQRFCDAIFFQVFSATLNEISLVLPLFALLEIVSACDVARDVFVTFHEDWIF